MGNGITTQTSHQGKLKLKIGHGLKWHGRARKHGDPVLTCCPGKHKSLVLPGLRGIEFCLVFLAFWWIGHGGNGCRRLWKVWNNEGEWWTQLVKVITLINQAITSLEKPVELNSVKIVLNPRIGYRNHHQPSSLGPFILIKIQNHHLIKVKTHLNTT